MLIIKIYKHRHNRKVQKADGSEFEITYQEAEIIRPNKRPRVIEIRPPRNGVYEEGLYTLSAASFQPDEYERLSFAKYQNFIPLEDAMSIAEETLKEYKPQQKLNLQKKA